MKFTMFSSASQKTKTSSILTLKNRFRRQIYQYIICNDFEKKNKNEKFENNLNWMKLNVWIYIYIKFEQRHWYEKCENKKINLWLNGSEKTKTKIKKSFYIQKCNKIEIDFRFIRNFFFDFISS